MEKPQKVSLDALISRINADERDAKLYRRLKDAIGLISLADWDMLYRSERLFARGMVAGGLDAVVVTLPVSKPS